MACAIFRGDAGNWTRV